MVNALALHEMRVETDEDIIMVRRRVREIAEHRKFDSFATAAITTASSELARNIVVHGGSHGTAMIEEVSDGVRIGIRIAFEDDGPGIADVDRVLRGGHSTARSMGLGVSGSRRLVDEFAIDSRPGHGTPISAIRNGKPSRRA